MSYLNFLLLNSVVTKWVGFILHHGLSIQQQKVFKVSIVKRALPSDLAMFFSLPLVRGVQILACVWFYFQYQVSTQKPTHMMTCTYDFLCCHIYVKSTILSGSHILLLQGTRFISPITSPKNNFSKVRLVSETARQYISKEPIKSQYVCTNALELIRL